MTSPSSDLRRELLGTRPGRELLGLLRAGGLRAVSRLVGLGGWTAGCLIVFLTGHGALLVSPGRRRWWRRTMVRRWARGLGRIVGMRVEIEGPPPAPPFFLVTNHLSYVDIVLLLGQVDAVFVAKRELADWPFIGYLTRIAGTIFVDRRRSRDALRVLGVIETRIATGEGIVVFPEGTSSGGADVYPMRPALFEWAARTGHPVRVATIRYESPPGSPPADEAICWWGDMSFVPHVIALCRLPGFRAAVRFADQALVGSNRTELAARAREAISLGLAAPDGRETE